MGRSWWTGEGLAHMVMLSELRRQVVIDDRDRKGRFLDMAVDLATGDYPTLTRIFYQGLDGTQVEVPWDAVKSSDWGNGGGVHIHDLAAGRPAPNESLRGAVLLKRDVLDSLVLDILNRQTMRANDLWLREQNDRLLLAAVDVSPWAVIRRLGRGKLGHGTDTHLVDWKYIEFLRGDPRAAAAGRDYHRRVASLPAVEIARLVDAMPYLHAAEMLTLLPDPIATDALETMLPERQLQVFEELDEQQGSRLLGLMAPDRAADLLGHLKQEQAQTYLDLLPARALRRVVALLQYPDDTAGGIMTNDIVVTTVGITAGEARRTLADRLKEPDFVYYIYVVGDEMSNRLCGVLTLRDLYIARDDQRIEDIMHAHPKAIGPLDKAVDAARRVADDHFAALPVADAEGRLLGAITVDGAMPQIAPETWRDQAPRIFS